MPGHRLTLVEALLACTPLTGQSSEERTATEFRAAVQRSMSASAQGARLAAAREAMDAYLGLEAPKAVQAELERLALIYPEWATRWLERAHRALV